MAITQPIDLEAFEEAVKQRIKDNFPSVRSVTFDYVEDDKLPAVPAILLELVQVERAEDMGTGQWFGTGRFEARCMVGALNKTHGNDVRKLALALAAYINQTKWGIKQADGSELSPQPVSNAKVIGCFPDGFEPRLEQMDVWRVEWEQDFCVGTSVWIPTGEIPAEVFVSENGENHHLLEIE